MAVELVNLRNECSKTFVLEDGRRQLIAKPCPVHYKNDYLNLSEQWKEIDLRPVGGRIDKAPYILQIDPATLSASYTDKKTGKTTVISVESIADIPISSVLSKLTRTLESDKNVTRLKVGGIHSDIQFEIVATRMGVSFRRIIKEGVKPTAIFKQTGDKIPVLVRAFDYDGKFIDTQHSVIGDNINETVTLPSNVKYPISIDPTITPFSSASDGYIVQQDPVYATVWAAATGTVTAGLTTTLIGQQFNVDYYIYRSFFFFDTSALPDTAAIISAFLALYGQSDGSTTDFDITIQNGQPTYPHDPMVIGDYAKANYAGDGGSFNTAGFSTVAYNNINLNATGLTWISKTGTTKLAVRSSRDIAGTAADPFEYVFVYASEEAGVNKDPYLSVTYSLSVSGGSNASKLIGSKLI